MLDALKGQLCLKLCQHNIRSPSEEGGGGGRKWRDRGEIMQRGNEERGEEKTETGK